MLVPHLHNESYLLVGDQLSEALRRGEIFAMGTWDQRQLRHTAYDLRVARDLSIVPITSANGTRAHRRFLRGQPGPRAFDLLPGESAFVSTLERIHLAWSITGTVGTKFAMAAKGLLILTGSCIDPGFGMVLDESGAWQPSQDQRLHFVLANVGPEPIEVATETDAIATLQLYRVPLVETDKRRPVVSEGFSSIEQTYLADVSAPPVLAYFKQISDMRQDVDRLAHESEQNARRAEVAVQGVNTVVLFGIYLLAVTVLGLVFATFVGGAGKLLDSPNWWQRGIALGFLAGVLLILGILTSAIIGALRRLR